MLKIPDLDKEFVVCTDSCKKELGGVLMQDGQVVCDKSRKLNEHEHKYPKHDLELATIIHASKMWKHYLMGRRFTLINDHSGLQYLLDQLNLNGRDA